MDRCFRCGMLVDTDDDGDCYIQRRVSTGRLEDFCYCESCRDREFSYCDHCSQYVGPDEMAPDTEWCQNCVDAAADLVHDMAKEA